MRTATATRLSRVAVAAAIAAGCLGPVQWAAAQTSCDELVGTYLTTITDREGVFSSRGLMTFAAGGVLIMSDSAQGGVPGVWDPFSPSQGAWSCAGAGGDRLRVDAVGLNFVLPADGRRPSLGRVDYQAELDPKTRHLAGKATLRFYPDTDLEGTNPTGEPGELADEFQFDGMRVAVEPRTP